LAIDEIDPASILDGATALVIDGSSPDAQRQVAEVAASRGIPVVLDGGRVVEGLSDLAARVDVLICSERLAADLAPRKEPRQALAELQRLGPRAGVISLGGAGSIGLMNGQVIEQPSFPVEVQDRTGAGAVYQGAFAAGLVGGLGFARCMEIASAAA